MKWYAEIDETGFCFHATQNELPLSETILLADENVLGKVWTGTEWLENEPEEPIAPASDPVMEKLESIETKIQTNAEMEEFYNAVCQEVGLV